MHPKPLAAGNQSRRRPQVRRRLQLPLTVLVGARRGPRQGILRPTDGCSQRNSLGKVRRRLSCTSSHSQRCYECTASLPFADKGALPGAAPAVAGTLKAPATGYGLVTPPGPSSGAVMGQQWASRVPSPAVKPLGPRPPTLPASSTVSGSGQLWASPVPPPAVAVVPSPASPLRTEASSRESGGSGSSRKQTEGSPPSKERSVPPAGEMAALSSPILAGRLAQAALQREQAQELWPPGVKLQPGEGEPAHSQPQKQKEPLRTSAGEHRGGEDGRRQEPRSPRVPREDGARAAAKGPTSSSEVPEPPHRRPRTSSRDPSPSPRPPWNLASPAPTSAPPKAAWDQMLWDARQARSMQALEAALGHGQQQQQQAGSGASVPTRPPGPISARAAADALGTLARLVGGGRGRSDGGGSSPEGQTPPSAESAASGSVDEVWKQWTRSSSSIGNLRVSTLSQPT